MDRQQKQNKTKQRARNNNNAANINSFQSILRCLQVSRTWTLEVCFWTDRGLTGEIAGMQCTHGDSPEGKDSVMVHCGRWGWRQVYLVFAINWTLQLVLCIRTLPLSIAPLGPCVTLTQQIDKQTDR